MKKSSFNINVLMFLNKLTSKSNRLWKGSELSFQRVIGLIAITHHTKGICHPEPNKVLKTISLLPHSHASEIVVVLDFHILDHPLEALSVGVVPSAETTSFFWPEINHLSCHIGWVWNNGGNKETGAHEEEFAPLVADVIIYPQQEELILHEDVKVHKGSPEQELVHG